MKKKIVSIVHGGYTLLAELYHENRFNKYLWVIAEKIVIYLLMYFCEQRHQNCEYALRTSCQSSILLNTVSRTR